MGGYKKEIMRLLMNCHREKNDISKEDGWLKKSWNWWKVWENKSETPKESQLSKMIGNDVNRECTMLKEKYMENNCKG